MAVSFEDFLMMVPQERQGFVSALHQNLTERGCTLVIKDAKNGYVVSYQWQKKTVLNWVFRKAGVLARIYGQHAGQYEALIAALPAELRKKMTDAPDCRRLLDPCACSPTCAMGLVYSLEGETHKKCRNSGMFFLLTPESGPHIASLVEAELAARQYG